MSENLERLQVILLDFGLDLQGTEPIYKQLNSIALMELVMRLEEEFHFEMSAIEYNPKQFRDIHSIAELLQNRS